MAAVLLGFGPVPLPPANTSPLMITSTFTSVLPEPSFALSFHGTRVTNMTSICRPSRQPGRALKSHRGLRRQHRSIWEDALADPPLASSAPSSDGRRLQPAALSIQKLGF
jgi:hypothetical protein